MAEGYSETTLDHYESPRNLGLIESPDAAASHSNPICGDRLRLTLRINNREVQSAGFEVQGCVAATAAASVMTELVLGRSLAEIEKLRSDEILRALGGLPPGRAHGASLAAETLAAALADFRLNSSAQVR